MKTIYEINYQTRLNAMLDMVIHKWGYEHEYTLYFANEMDKRYNDPTYENREKMEKIFKGLVK